MSQERNAPLMGIGDAQLIHFGQRAIVAASQATALAMLASLEPDEVLRRLRIAQSLECIDVSNRHLRFSSECMDPGV